MEGITAIGRRDYWRLNGEEVVVAIQVGVVSAEDWNVVEDVNVKVWIRFEKKNGNSEDWNSRRDKEEWCACLSLAADWLQFEQGYVQISSELKQGILEVNSKKIEMNSKIYFDARFDAKSGVATNDFLENFNLKVEMYEDRSVNKGINTDIIIQTNEEFISYSNFILLIISMMIKLSYYSRAFRKISNLYEESQLWYCTSQLIIYGFLLILTLLEVRVINEMVPLENNSAFYILLTIIQIFISAIITSLIDIKIEKYNFNLINQNTDFFVFIFMFSVISHIFYYLTEKDSGSMFTCINFRVIYCCVAICTVPLTLINAILKQRNRVEFLTIFPLTIDFVVYLYYRYAEIVRNNLHSDYILIKVFALLCITELILKLQEQYGSRCFMPNICRNKVFEYRKEITDDYFIIDDKAIPNCDLCMEKLNRTSLLTENRSLSKIEGIECYKKYMKAGNARNYHYFCLEYIISNPQLSDLNFPKIDEYTD